MLSKLEFDLGVEENGSDTLAALENDTFDLELMDIQMLVMNGEEALREILTKELGTSNNLPVIALTAYSLRGVKRKRHQLHFRESVVQSNLYSHF